MPGTDDRTPSDADRPPASRVGDELQPRANEDVDDPAKVEDEAFAAAQQKGWDKEQRNQA
jgi:hypothetical protein